MIQTIKNFFEGFSHSHPIYSIINGIEKNNTLCSSKVIQSSEQWIRFEYVFSKKVHLSFILYKSNTTSVLEYDNVIELVIIQLQNVFLDCRIIMKDKKEQFWVLSDVYKIDFTIEGNKE